MNSLITPCFYCPNIPATGESVDLDEKESHHVIGSRRLQIGQWISVIDGQGLSADARIKGINSRRVTLVIEHRKQHAVSAQQLTIATAVPKGDRFSTMIDMLTQLGVFRIIPLICERSTVKPEQRTYQRWNRIALEACKQSRNPYLPTIDEPINLNAFLDRHNWNDIPVLFADRESKGYSRRISSDQIVVCVGPEGGFSDNEFQQLVSRGAFGMSLGHYILRVETAAVAAATALLSTEKA